MLRKPSKVIGKIAGVIVGEPIKFIGEKTNSQWIKDVGEGVKNASGIAFENAGQLFDGAFNIARGYIQKDEKRKMQGIEELKQSVVRTARAVGKTVVFTAKNSGEVVMGLAYKDKERALHGVRNIAKVVAVSTLAVGVVDLFDVLDDAEAVELDTRNDNLVNQIHPETGVPFVEKTVELPDGSTVKGVFPVFESPFQVILSEELYTASDEVQFSVANDMLAQAIIENPELASHFSSTQLAQINSGETPQGYVWHHHEEMGVLQLVDKEIHENTGHTGGRTLWGGGTSFR